MITVVNGGRFTNDAINHGLVNQRTVNEVKQATQSFASSLGSGVSNWFKQSVNDSFERFGGAKVRARLESLMAKADNFWKADTIMPMNSIQMLQHAKPMMREIIMSHDVLSRRADDQMCHAYDGNYRRHEGHREDNHMWRLIHQGEENTTMGHTGWHTYCDEPEDSEHMTPTQLTYAKLTHTYIDELLEHEVAYDITDPLNTGW